MNSTSALILFELFYKYIEYVFKVIIAIYIILVLHKVNKLLKKKL
ncbi:MAG: hypothetical protein K0R50_2932 [Eubacterium sp.]|jgi:hypothetical protein|nr:hypothetical protein [Eubacterium sp.]